MIKPPVAERALPWGVFLEVRHFLTLGIGMQSGQVKDFESSRRPLNDSFFLQVSHNFGHSDLMNAQLVADADIGELFGQG